MNVNGLGGAASLPVTLPSSSSHQPAAAAPPGTAGATGSGGTSGPGGPGRPTGDLRLPGQQRAPQNEAASKPEKEIPKPAPLPPLRGLTVAEIRAMLGVAPLPGQVEAAAAGLAPGLSTSGSLSTAAFDRYA